LLESVQLAGRIAHAAVIEAHRCDAALRELACEQNELPVTSHPILRTADDDQHSSSTGLVGRGDDADE
jgi:hypothetical protein